MKTKNLFLVILLLFVAMLPNSFAQDNTQLGLPEGAIARLGKGGINVMQFSPDGTRLAVGTEVGVWLYTVPDGKETPLYTENCQGIKALAFSSDGKFLASGGSANSVIQLWDLKTGNTLSTFTLPHKYFGISAIVFSQHSNTFFSLDDTGFIIEWDIKTGKDISKKQFDNSRPVTAFSEDGKTIVCGDQKECVIQLWDVNGASFGRVFKERPNPSFRKSISKLLGGNLPANKKKVKIGVQALAISSDSVTVGSAHDDNTVRLWDTATGTERVSLKGHTEIINSLTFSTDNTMLASCSTDNTIIVWDVQNGRQHFSLIGHKDNIKAVAFSPVDKGLLASGSSDGTVRLWNTTTGKERSIIATGHTESVKTLAFTADNTLLCSGASNGTVQIWNVQTRKELPSPALPHQDMTTALGFSSDATLFACHAADVTVMSEGNTTVSSWATHEETRLWIMPTGDELTSLPHKALTVTFSPDNKRLAVSTRQDGIQISDINTGKKILSLDVENSYSRKLVFSPDGKLLATNDGKLLTMNGDKISTQVWDINTQQKISPPDIKNASALAFSPDSTLLALKHSAGIDVWRVAHTVMQKQKTIQYKDSRKPTKILLFSPDGKFLLGSRTTWLEYLITIWDVETGNDLETLSGHTKWIDTLVFSHDGKILASGSDDGTILLWDWEKIISKAKENKGD